jgi:hypothetical protein
MRRIALLTTLALLSVIWAACGEEEQAAGTTKPSVYFGWVLGTADITGIALEADPVAANGKRTIRAYVCDGLGPPRGKAVWFTGSVDPATINGTGKVVRLKSAGKRETLTIDRFDARIVKGSFVDAKGRRTQFAAPPATDGAGIYEVTLDKSLRYTGVSTDGSKVAAQTTKKGFVTGTLTTADGARLPFSIRTLSLASPAELANAGLSKVYRQDAKRSLVPGEYVAVIAPSGTHWLGRIGNVRLGKAGAEIIGLDKKG